MLNYSPFCHLTLYYKLVYIITGEKHLLWEKKMVGFILKFWWYFIQMKILNGFIKKN